jgi:hypothetical protein
MKSRFTLGEAVQSRQSGSTAIPVSTGTRIPSHWVSRYPLLSRVAEKFLTPQVILLLAVTLVVSRGITQGELHFYSDETRHAFTGVFFRDLIANHPFANPIQYTYEYYAKYPAVSLPHWPPLFHIVEGVFFLVFGISVWVSRLTVLVFALIGAYFWYRIAEQFGPRYRAFLSALIFACLPFVLLYERVTMLEVPVVSLCLGAIFFWLRYRQEARSRDLWMLTGFVIAAFLTNQAAIFLTFFVLLDLFVGRHFRMLARWRVWAALGIALALVLPWYWLTLRTLTFVADRAVTSDLHYLSTSVNSTYYLRGLPQQLGLPLLCLAVVGAGYALIAARRRYGFLLLWIFACYLCFTVVTEKDYRHTMIWIPPFVYLALLGVETLLVRPRLALVGTTLLGLFFLVTALRFERPRVAGVEEVTRYVLSLPESDIVYYQGELNGDFVFFVRKFDPERRRMVAREKQVVVNMIGHGPHPVIRTSEGIFDFLQNWGIRYVVAESVDFVPGLDPMNAALGTDQFELLRTFPVQSNDPHFAKLTISVYRYRGELHRGAEAARIPMMTIRNDIPVDLNRLAGRPWPN